MKDAGSEVTTTSELSDRFLLMLLMTDTIFKCLMCVCAGVVRGHKTEGQELFYSVEKDGQRQWYNRTAVILSLEQGNKLREQHSLGPYEPFTPLAKASDISLGEI